METTPQNSIVCNQIDYPTATLSSEQVRNFFEQHINNKTSNLIHYSVLFADKHNAFDATQWLIKSGFRTHFSGDPNGCPVIESIMINRPEILKLLLENGANANEKTEDTSALHLATRMNKPWMVRLLLEHGANPNHPNAKGKGALHFAAKSGDDTIIQLLFKHGADMNPKDMFERYAIEMASRASTIELMMNCGSRLIYKTTETKLFGPKNDIHYYDEEELNHRFEYGYPYRKKKGPVPFWGERYSEPKPPPLCTLLNGPGNEPTKTRIFELVALQKETEKYITPANKNKSIFTLVCAFHFYDRSSMPNIPIPIRQLIIAEAKKYDWPERTWSNAPYEFAQKIQNSTAIRALAQSDDFEKGKQALIDRMAKTAEEFTHQLDMRVPIYVKRHGQAYNLYRQMLVLEAISDGYTIDLEPILADKTALITAFVQREMAKHMVTPKKLQTHKPPNNQLDLETKFAMLQSRCE